MISWIFNPEIDHHPYILTQKVPKICIKKANFSVLETDLPFACSAHIFFLKVN